MLSRGNPKYESLKHRKNLEINMTESFHRERWEVRF